MWHTITFELTQHDGAALNRIYMYLDGGTTVTKQGTICFDDLAIGDSVSVIQTPAYTALELALQQATALYENTVKGGGEGEFPAGSKADLQAAINAARQVYEQDDAPPDTVKAMVWDLYDACATLEASVNASEMGLVDPHATKETRYLYGNLLQSAGKGLVFGMHDVTGYGVGWSGDDDRSDVKDVCGDYPALYSEDANKITRGLQVERMRYRLTSAYRRGGIITFSWHQYDPDDRHFYADRINNERIVETIIPGGERHSDYKEKLRRLALFLKSLRGDTGESIPVIFRPYHEHLGDWFWWGAAHCTKSEYNTLWQFTVDYMRDSLNVHNLIWAFSPSLNHIDQGDDYFDVYPGDEYVDIFGTDNYFSHPVSKMARDQFRIGLHKVVEHANARNKLPALTEVGQEGLKP
ncbi:MAG: glycosyl hydrolase [candidate division KSB1 bacterium]|nr:glycosyl hydrolase [candidate division KSB1 bacterium]